MPLDRYKCPSSSSPLTSLNTTVCREKHSMAMFKWRFDMACTGYHKPNKLLTQCLGRHGYFEVQHTPSCWKHISCPIWFNLCVENFCIKNIGDENLNHLSKAPHTETYEIVEDWASSIYCGIRLELGVVHSVGFRQDSDRTWPKSLSGKHVRVCRRRRRRHRSRHRHCRRSGRCRYFCHHHRLPCQLRRYCLCSSSGSSGGSTAAWQHGSTSAQQNGSTA